MVRNLQSQYSDGVSIGVIPLGKNVGAPAARNTAWKGSTQPYIAFLDADDLWNPRKLECQVRLLSDMEAIACICGYEIFDSATGRSVGVVRPKDATRAVTRALSMEGHGLGAGSTALVDREGVERIGRVADIDQSPIIFPLMMPISSNNPPTTKQPVFLFIMDRLFPR